MHENPDAGLIFSTPIKMAGRGYWRGVVIGEAGFLERRGYWRGGVIVEAGLLEGRDY